VKKCWLLVVFTDTITGSMSFESIVSARIHPAIGVARIGDSAEEYFIGPEVVDPPPAAVGSRKDKQGRLKRQAALFRVYGYDKDNQVVAELTAAEADIVWDVHVANKKGAWYDFVMALDSPDAAAITAPRRNSNVSGSDRTNLIIDPGPRKISGSNAPPVLFDSGKFFGTQVYLGELQTDEAGRLRFLGGRGVSGSPFPGNPLSTFANNACWYDDISDGPVSATVKMNGRDIPVDPAWVVVGPPDYAPDIVTVQTMYDVIYNALAGSWLTPPPQPSFMHDILPILRQFVAGQWVNAGFLAQFGWGGPNDFLRSEMLAKLGAPGNTYQEMRRQMFHMLRDPNGTTYQPLQWPPIYGDSFGNFDSSPRAGFSLTDTLYGFFEQWFQGDFLSDYDPNWRSPSSLNEVPLPEQPAMLDRAALHFCMGGPFHPGCEMTWPMRLGSMYRAPFRLRQQPAGLSEPDYGEYLTQSIVLSNDGPLSASGPGDISKWMAIPWQADTASCRSGYTPDFDPYLPTFWPSRVPNQVLTEENYRVVMDESNDMETRTKAFYDRSNWLRGLGLKQPYIEQITKMVKDFGELGVVERHDGPDIPEFPPYIYVESTPAIHAPRALRATLEKPGEAADEAAVSEDFRNARFGGSRLHRR
jgi:hypothetical protein